MRRALSLLPLVLLSLVFPASSVSAQGTADISISVTPSASAVVADSDLTYTITVANAGPDAAEQTVIVDTLPAEVMVRAVSGSGTYDATTNQVTWSAGTLNLQASTTQQLVVRPIHPSSVTNTATATTSSADPTTPNTASAKTTVAAEPDVQYISVRDSSITPHFRNVPLGTTLQWDFFGPGVHEITDSHGLGLFDSGAVTPVDYFRYTFDLSAEIRTMDSGYPNNTGKIVIPVQVSPASGDEITPFTVTWALSPLPAGFVEDVQIKRPGSTTWQTFHHGTTELNDPSFVADAGPGTYAFRDRVRNTTSSTHSRFGPPVPVVVTG